MIKGSAVLILAGAAIFMQLVGMTLSRKHQPKQPAFDAKPTPKMAAMPSFPSIPEGPGSYIPLSPTSHGDPDDNNKGSISLPSIPHFSQLPGVQYTHGPPKIPPSGLPNIPGMPGMLNMPAMPKMDTDNRKIPAIPRVPHVPGVPDIPRIPAIPKIPRIVYKTVPTPPPFNPNEPWSSSSYGSFTTHTKKIIRHKHKHIEVVTSVPDSSS